MFSDLITLVSSLVSDHSEVIMLYPVVVKLLETKHLGTFYVLRDGEVSLQHRKAAKSSSLVEINLSCSCSF